MKKSTLNVDKMLKKNNISRNNMLHYSIHHCSFYKFPLASCSRSNASNKALKLPLPKLFAPLR